MTKEELCQFFTHPYVASFMTKLVNPKKGETVIDPACGDGVFFSQIYTYNPEAITYGCEIDKKTYKLAKLNNPNSHIFLHNGLYSHALKSGEKDFSDIIKDNSYDCVLANPPFYGIKNKITDKKILSLFKGFLPEGAEAKSEIIEVLFLERFVNLLKENGRLCTILPEGILSDKRLGHFRNWLFNQITVEAVISLPEKGVFGDASVNVVILCGRKKPVVKENQKTLYVKDIQLEELEVLLDYMKRNKIFYEEG